MRLRAKLTDINEAYPIIFSLRCPLFPKRMCLSRCRRTNAAETKGKPDHENERHIRPRSSAVTVTRKRSMNSLKIPPTHSIEFDEQRSDSPAPDSAGRALSHR